MSNGYCGGYSYIVRTGSLIVLHKYKVDRSLCGVQENLRNRPEPLTVIQVTDCAS